MSYINETAEVLAVGQLPNGQRARLVAKALDYSGDLRPDGDGYIPQFFMGLSYGRFGMNAGINLQYLPVDEDAVMNAIQEFRCRFNRSRQDWKEITERWLRIMGAERASIGEVQLDQSSWGIMVAAYGPEWRELTGVKRGYEIEDTDTREFEHWLKGEVSQVVMEVADDDCDCENCAIHRAMELDMMTCAVCKPTGADYQGDEECQLSWDEDDDELPSMIVYASPFDILQDQTGSYGYVTDEFRAVCKSDSVTIL